MLNHKSLLIDSSSALPGRETEMVLTGADGARAEHFVLHTPIQPPFEPEQGSVELIQLALGCFWGAERKFWELEGVYTTAVGYAGGFTPNPTYEEVCSGLTAHTEVVLVAYQPSIITLEAILKVFFESHNPTQGMRQGNDVGTQYRSAIYYYTKAQQAVCEHVMTAYQQQLTKQGYPAITTECEAQKEFYYAEAYHQQYLAKNPNGYCGLGGTGVQCIV